MFNKSPDNLWNAVFNVFQGGTMTNEMWKEVSGCIAQILHMRDQIKEMAGEYRGDS